MKNFHKRGGRKECFDLYNNSVGGWSTATRLAAKFEKGSQRYYLPTHIPVPTYTPTHLFTSIKEHH